MAEIIDYPRDPEVALRRMLASKDIPQPFQALRESLPGSEHSQVEAFAEQMLAVQAEAKAAKLAGASIEEIATIAAGTLTISHEIRQWLDGLRLDKTQR